ncbi:MAG: hypothetical protein ACYCQH_10995 [Acidithiobacillus ferrooxidans]
MQRISEETFRILVNAGSVRKITLQPALWNSKERWAVVLQLGMGCPGSHGTVNRLKP